MNHVEVLQIISGGIGATAFAILFHIRGKRLLAASVGGFLSWFLFVVLGFMLEGEVIRYFLVAILISIYAELMARILKTPATTCLMPTLIPLIPGGSLYYTMSSIFEQGTEVFISKAKDTLALSAALALGIVITNMITRMIRGFIELHNRELSR